VSAHVASVIGIARAGSSKGQIGGAGVLHAPERFERYIQEGLAWVTRHVDAGRVETATLYRLTDLGRSLDGPLAVDGLPRLSAMRGSVAIGAVQPGLTIRRGPWSGIEGGADECR
jgi:hypothetical protein